MKPFLMGSLTGAVSAPKSNGLWKESIDRLETNMADGDSPSDDGGAGAVWKSVALRG